MPFILAGKWENKEDNSILEFTMLIKDECYKLRFSANEIEFINITIGLGRSRTDQNEYSIIGGGHIIEINDDKIEVSLLRSTKIPMLVNGIFERVE